MPFKTEPSTLIDRLERFDIALSAIGVECRPNGNWVALVHDRALLSVEQQEILLLEPLVNWKYALVTLERMRRYAKELGFSVSSDGEAAIWKIFYSQPSSVREEMLARFETNNMGGYGVEEDLRLCSEQLRASWPMNVCFGSEGGRRLGWTQMAAMAELLELTVRQVPERSSRPALPI